MSILNKLKTKTPSQNVGEFSLTQSELEFVLALIKNSVFKGEQLEELYTIVYKLQNQYLEQN
jgi:hypothetical protein